jgi:5-methylcytosine-specific restriction protein A
MPYRATKVCSRPSCGNLSQGGRCQNCRGERERQRGTAHSRGYTAAWRKLRLVVLGCGGTAAPCWLDGGHALHGPLCVECRAIATDVDHIQTLRDGGRDEGLNLRSYCRGCHARRTLRDSVPRP